MKKSLLIGMFSLTAAVSTSAVAQQPDAAADTQSPSATDAADEVFENEIVVKGYTKKDIRTFLSRSLRETGGLIARRTDEVCIGIDNIPAEIAGPVAERIKQNIRSIQHPVAEKGCRVNAAIVFHRDPAAMVAKIAEVEPKAFDSLYKPEKKRLINKDRRVYSWMRLGAGEGQSYDDPGIISDRNVLVGSSDAALTSRINTLPSEAILHSFTVVDMNALNGMTIEQLADFLTLKIMIEFESDRPDGAPSDSILNLFDVEDAELDAPPEMSVLDRELLRQVYDPSRPNIDSGGLRVAIAKSMIEGIDEIGQLIDGDEVNAEDEG